MGFVPPPCPEPGYPGGMGPNFRKWLKDRERDRLIFSLCMFVGVTLLIMVVTVRVVYLTGRSAGRREGYEYAEQKYQKLLRSYADDDKMWGNIKEWYRENGRVGIISPFDEAALSEAKGGEG